MSEHSGVACTTSNAAKAGDVSRVPRDVNRRSKSFITRTGIAVLLFVAAPHAWAQSGNQTPFAPLEQFSRSVQALTTRISPSVVRITVTRYGAESESGRTDAVISKERSVGSGVIVDPDGYILTNAHVVEGAQKVRVDLVPAGGETIPGVLTRSYTPPQNARVLGVFKEGDVALIKIAKTGLPALPFADYAKLRQGQVVFALGSPAGLQNSVSMGVVSSIARQPDPDSPFLFIQTDTPINPGNSGGPLVNIAGEIVGLNTFILTQSGGNEGVGFAIPSMLLKWVYGNLRQYGHVHRASVGMGIQAITPVLAAALKLPRQSGVIVSDVLSGGPADAAGIKLNDVLLSVSGRPIDSVPAMLGFFFEHGPGDHIKFEVLRGSQELTFDLVPVAPPHQADHLADLVDPGKDVIPSLGIMGVTVDKRIEAITGELRLPTGVVVAARVPNGTEAESGLQASDVIHAVNGTFVFTVEALKAAIAALKPGNPVAILLERHGQLLYVAFHYQ